MEGAHGTGLLKRAVGGIPPDRRLLPVRCLIKARASIGGIMPKPLTIDNENH